MKPTSIEGRSPRTEPEKEEKPEVKLASLEGAPSLVNTTSDVKSPRSEKQPDSARKEKPQVSGQDEKKDKSRSDKEQDKSRDEEKKKESRRDIVKEAKSERVEKPEVPGSVEAS